MHTTDRTGIDLLGYYRNVSQPRSGRELSRSERKERRRPTGRFGGRPRGLSTSATATLDFPPVIRTALGARKRASKITRSSATAKSTARPSCLVAVLYDISGEKICWRLINHFYIIGHESYTEFGEITQNNGHYTVQGYSRSPILVGPSIHSPYMTFY